MSLSRLEDLQVAVVAAWAAGAGLAGATLHYSKAPKGTRYPYGVFMLDLDDDQVFGGSASNARLQFNVFSDTATSSEASGLLGAIRAAFERTALGLSEHHLAVTPRVATETVFVNDSDHWQGTIIFEMRVQ